MIASPIKTMEDEFNAPTHNLGVAQSFDDSVKVRSIYNASRTLLTDLIHTKLEVSFDWSNASNLDARRNRIQFRLVSHY